ncbi:calcium-binding protein, partial [Acinetobacter sp. 1124_18A]
MANSFQVHHILPVELFNSEFKDEINKILGSDTSRVTDDKFKNTALQSFNNRIALYSDADRAEMAKALQDSGHPISDNPIGATQHYTSHPEYNKAVKQWVKEIIIDSNLTPEQKKLAIFDLQATLKEGLTTGEIILHGDNAKQSINDYLNQHTITLEQLSNPDSERYKQAETRLEIHAEHDIKYSNVANESVNVNTEGKTSAGNQLFTKTAIAEAIEIIKAQSYDSIPLTNLMKSNLEKLINGETLSDSSKKQIVENLIHAKAYANGITEKPPSGVYEKLVNSSADLGQNQQKTNQLTESLKNSAFSDSEKSNIQSEISRLQGEKLIIDAEIVKIQGTKESLNVNAGKFGQGGAIDIQVFGDALNKSMQVVNGTIETIRQDTQQIIKNNMLNVVDGQINLNLEMSNNLGKYLSESLIGGKVGAGVMAADFLNNTFEGLVVGLETGDWQPFQEQAIEYGPQALVGTVLFAAGAGLIPVVAGLLGVPVLGEVVLGGLLVYGAYEGGKAVGELLHKIYDHIVENGIPVPFGLDKVFDPNNISKWMDDVTPDFIKDWLGLNREGHHYYYDPLILDLDGDGIETIAHNKLNGALFDNDADGLKTATGWVSPHDGLLVFDRNADGIINDGTEVFGDNTYLKNGEKAEHGFDALADLDTDKNGKIDANDEDFAKLKVWRDLNQDGKSQENELFGLADLGIKSLNVAYNNTNTTLAGNNILVQVSSYEKTDGSTLKMGDVNFSFDSIYSEFTNRIEVSKEIKDLPELKGYGRVRDLHEAMSLSSDLEQLVRQYESAKTSEEQKSLLPELLKAWAKTDPSYHEYTESLWASMVSSSGQGVAVAGGNRGATISFDQVDPAVQAAFSAAKSKVGVIDSFLGTKTEKLFYIAEKDILKITESINNIYSNITFSIYKGLYGQTAIYKNYADEIQKEWFLKDNGDIGFILNFKNVEQLFESKLSIDIKNTFFELVQFTDHINNTYGDVPKKNYASLEILFFNYYEKLNADELRSLESLFKEYSVSINIFQGTDAADVLKGTKGNDKLKGGAGNDTLDGGTGSDLLEGGAGNDILYGGAGNNVYLFGRGDG